MADPTHELAFKKRDDGPFVRRDLGPKKLAGRIDPGAATADDLMTAAQASSRRGRWSPYWTVHRYDEPADYKSAHVDRAFLELECHPCGHLCFHTMQQARDLLTWSDRNDLNPLLLYSGNKSIHVYWFYPNANLERRWVTPTIKRVENIIVEGAAIHKHDEAVLKTGPAKMARLPGGWNADTGRRQILLTPMQFTDMEAGDIIKASAEGHMGYDLEDFYNLDVPMNPQLTEIAEATPDEIQHPDEVEVDYDIEDVDYEPCMTVKSVIKNGAEHGERYFSSLVVIDHYRHLGLSPEETFDKLQEWNRRNTPPMRGREMRRAVKYQYRNSELSKNPCCWLVNVDYWCPECTRRG